jgi:hypothetical protein
MSNNDKTEPASKDRPTAPAFARLIEQLNKYDPISEEQRKRLKFPDDWPNVAGLKWPTDFRPGAVTMDWGKLFYGLISWEIETQYYRPDGQRLTASDLTEIVEALASNPENDNVTVGVLLAMYYIMQHLPDKMNQALRDLMVEARWHADAALTAQTDQTAPPFTQIANPIAERERQAILARLNQDEKKPKSKRGQHRKWTKDTYHEAMRVAVRTLIANHNQQNGRLITQDKKLLARLATELHKTHPDKTTDSGESARKLIDRLELGPEWEALKAEWSAVNTRPMDSKPKNKTVQ